MLWLTIFKTQHIVHQGALIRTYIYTLLREAKVPTTHITKFYGVGNGDTAQIVLANGRRVLFDFCRRDHSEKPDVPEIDLNVVLKDELEKAGRDYFDVVAFTHADLDHIKGSTVFFELQHAKIYHGEGRIKIRQLWVPAAMLLEQADNDHQKEEFVLLRQEARHRLIEGKDILVFSKPEALREWLEPILEGRGEAPDARDHLFVDAGTIVPGFSLTSDGVEFFCHSPFIKHCDDGTDIIRNTASLVFNVRFDADGNQYDFLQVGDSCAEDLEDIVRTTVFHKRVDRLAWNLFNMPHHCSYLALNVSGQKGDKETKPAELVEFLLLQGKPTRVDLLDPQRSWKAVFFDFDVTIRDGQMRRDTRVDQVRVHHPLGPRSNSVPDSIPPVMRFVIAVNEVALLQHFLDMGLVSLVCAVRSRG